MAHQVIQGNVFDKLPELARGSADVCIYSPPYHKLRAYLPKGHPDKHLELGSEDTVEEYIANQVRVAALVRDVLSPWGTLWLNVGDSYSGGTSHAHQGMPELARKNRGGSKTLHLVGRPEKNPAPGIPAGNLCLIPWRLALALQEDGWLCRSVICWQKPSPMPASLSGWRWARHRVKVGKKERPRTPDHQARIEMGLQRDVSGLSYPGWREHGASSGVEWADCPGCDRCRPNDGLVLRKGSWRPTSSWEPILLLAKSASYFMDGEAVKTPSAPATVGRNRYTRVLDDPDEQFAVRHDHETTAAGANLRDVWRVSPDDLTREELVELVRHLQGADMPDTMRVSAEPLHAQHYAAFPSALVRKCLLAGTSARGYCPACSSPWVRVVETKFYGDCRKGRRDNDAEEGKNEWRGTAGVEDYEPAKTIGWRPSCRCEPVREPRPAVVLDPFCGAGRTGCAARQLGLGFVGVELNEASCEIARRQIDNALRETKRQRPAKGGGLFDGLAAPGPGGGQVP